MLKTLKILGEWFEKFTISVVIVVKVNEVAYEGGGQDRECVVSACAHLIHKLHYSKAFHCYQTITILLTQCGTACNRIQ